MPYKSNNFTSPQLTTGNELYVTCTPSEMHTTIEHTHSTKLLTFLFTSSSATEIPTTRVNQYNADGSQKSFEIFSVHYPWYRVYIMYGKTEKLMAQEVSTVELHQFNIYHTYIA